MNKEPRWRTRNELPKDGTPVVTIGRHSSDGRLVTCEIIYSDDVGFIDNITHWTPLNYESND